MDTSDPMEARRCTAQSKQWRRRCRRTAIVGGRVCSAHGGKAPQVARSAAERLAALVDPAIAELARLVRRADSDTIKLAAIKDVLDRAGYKPKERVEQTGKLTIEVVYGDDSPSSPETPALGPATDQE
jgi:hypothetical protein